MLTIDKAFCTRRAYNHTWHLLERKIPFLYIFVCFVFFLLSAFSRFFFLFSVYPHFFHPPFTIRIFPSASAIRRYPVRVLLTPRWYRPLQAFDQGHPTTVFCKISVQSSKYSLEFSITWGRLFLDDRPIHGLCNFRNSSNKFPKIFWSLRLHIALPRLVYFSLKRRNLKYSDSKMWSK